MGIAELVPSDLPPDAGSLTVREILHQIVPATTILQHRLQFDDDQVLMIEQVILLGGVPLFHAIGYSSVETADRVSRVLTGLDRHPRHIPLADVFEQMFGAPLGRVETTIEATRTEARITRLLQIEPTAATLVRELTAYDIHGRPRSYNFMHFRADRISFEATSS
jgi:GntR family transcriptional regulator